MPMHFRKLVIASLLSLLAGVATAQEPISSLLPDTTVLAVHVSPEGFDASAVAEMLGELDIDEAGDVLMALLGAFEGAAGAAGLSDELADLDVFGDLERECQGSGAILHEMASALGPTAAGVSVSRFDPEPALTLVTRPGDPSLAEEFVERMVACMGGDPLGTEGDAEIWVVGDGGDFPLVLAAAEGVLAVSSDPEVLRGVLRRAAGGDDAGLADTRVGRLSAGLTSRGAGFTLNLAAAADALEAFRFAAAGGDGTAALFDRLLTTLRVVDGFAWHATVDAGGLLVESVATFDAALAREAGEDELLRLLTCSSCEMEEPALLPRDAVALSGGVMPLGALVSWLDTWLADLADLGAVPEGWDLRSAAGELLGVDANAALLGWIGDSWHAATLDVLATDLRGWLSGLPTLVTVPVSSEQEARKGIEMWPAVIDGLADLAQSLEEGTEVEGAFRFDEAVSVREGSYRGIDYTRYRTGPGTDVGVAVLGGHLVIGSPATSLHDAIDIHLGGVASSGAAWRTLEGLNLGGADFVAYDVAAMPEFLSGLAQISDLLAGPFAWTVWLGVQGLAMAADPSEVPTDLPSYDDLIRLADVVTDGLLLLADRTGPAVGTTELVNGARWSTWRLPLR